MLLDGAKLVRIDGTDEQTMSLTRDIPPASRAQFGPKPVQNHTFWTDKIAHFGPVKSQNVSDMRADPVAS